MATARPLPTLHAGRRSVAPTASDSPLSTPLLSHYQDRTAPYSAMPLTHSSSSSCPLLHLLLLPHSSWLHSSPAWRHLPRPSSSSPLTSLSSSYSALVLPLTVALLLLLRVRGAVPGDVQRFHVVQLSAVWSAGPSPVAGAAEQAAERSGESPKLMATPHPRKRKPSPSSPPTPPPPPSPPLPATPTLSTLTSPTVPPHPPHSSIPSSSSSHLSHHPVDVDDDDDDDDVDVTRASPSLTFSASTHLAFLRYLSRHRLELALLFPSATDEEVDAIAEKRWARLSRKQRREYESKPALPQPPAPAPPPPPIPRVSSQQQAEVIHDKADAPKQLQRERERGAAKAAEAVH